MLRLLTVYLLIIAYESEVRLHNPSTNLKKRKIISRIRVGLIFAARIVGVFAIGEGDSVSNEHGSPTQG